MKTASVRANLHSALLRGCSTGAFILAIWCCRTSLAATVTECNSNIQAQTTSDSFRVVAQENRVAATNRGSTAKRLLSGDLSVSAESSTVAKRLPRQPNVAEGPCAAGSILLDWDLCERKGENQGNPIKPVVYAYPSLEFARTQTGWVAIAHLRYASWPHCAWKLTVRLLNRSGERESVLQTVQAVQANSGKMDRAPLTEEAEVRLHLRPGHAPGENPADLFQAGLETMWVEQGNSLQWAEALPLRLDFSNAERSGVLRAQSLQLEEAANGVRATIKAMLVSWPKSRWQMTLVLTDAAGQMVGRSQRDIENSGWIRRIPSVGSENFALAIPGDSRVLHTAVRWNLRIERVPLEKASVPDTAPTPAASSTSDHVRVRAAGIGEEYTRAIAQTVEAARTIALERFGFDMPDTIRVSVSVEPGQGARLFNDGRDRITLRVPSEAALAKPSTSRIFHLYGLCHEIGHLAMYRVVRNRDWLSSPGAEGWAYYAGARILDEVYAMKGESLWPDAYDYREDGTARLRRQLSASNPNATRQAAGLWMALAEILGDKSLAPLFADWARVGSAQLDPDSDVYQTLLAHGDKDRLEGWWTKAKPVIFAAILRSEFAAQTIDPVRLKGPPQELACDDGVSAGQRSVAGSGHAVRFQAPGEDWYLTALRVFGARYGHSAPPKDQGQIWLCDPDFRLITTIPCPYAGFERGAAKWVTIPITPTRLPAEFIVCVGFNPTGKKGVFVHHDRQGSGRSCLGLPGRKTSPMERGDWLIRAVIRRANDQ